MNSIRWRLQRNAISVSSILRIYYLLFALLVGCGFFTFSSDAQITCTASAPPAIRIVADNNGVQRFSLAGQSFVPIGVNYLIEGHGTYNGNSYQTFDMFDTQNFSLATIDQNMASIAGDGYTYVRLWLKGIDTDNGFSSPNAWNKYVANIVATIQDAEKYKLHVVLTGSFPGPTGTWLVPQNYQPTSLPSNVAGLNQMFLAPAMVQALARYYSDLLTAILALDPTIAPGIFYFDLYNEAKFDTTALPLSLSTGSFQFNNVNYNLSDFSIDDSSDPNSRQAMMDAATVYFMQTVGAPIRKLMPNVLLTASTFNNYAVNHNAFDGGVTKSTRYYALRPFYVLRGGGMIMDVHYYASTTSVGHTTVDMVSNEFVTSSATPSGTQVNSSIAPFLAGEFGAEPSDFVTTGVTYVQGLEAAITQMNATRSPLFCTYGYSGYGVWEWNVVPSSTFVLVDPTNDPNSLYLQATAPLYVPQFCGQAITASAAIKKAPMAGPL
jgi:hypothetical protein